MTTSQKLAKTNFHVADGNLAEVNVGYLTKRVVLSIVREANKRLGRCGLTDSQWGPLLHIKQAGGSTTVADLSRLLQTDPGAMTRLVDRLESKRLCKRVRSTEDRRVVHVELTPEGEAAIINVPGILSDVLNQHLAGFSKGEWIALKSYLKRICNNSNAIRDTDADARPKRGALVP